MKVTNVYTQTLEALLNKYRIIINRGGTRSSKTYSELQIFKTIADNSTSKEIEINTVVSHSLPHLEGGAIRDFDNILTNSGIDLYKVKRKNPHIYTLNNQIIEFIGFDRPGKALGAARKRLFINEANKMPFDICHQLMQRTTSTIFIDYNPAHEFWVDTEGYLTRKDSKVIDSTYLDNIQNLTEGQLNELMEAKKKHDEEVSQGVKGYWYNYWRVYGLGLPGSIEGTILTNWIEGEFDNSLPYIYGLDFGVKDEDAMLKCAIDRKNKKVYWDEKIYQNNLSTDQLKQLINANIEKWNDLIIADTSGKRTIKDYKNDFNIKAVNKPNIVESIKDLMNFQLIITPTSKNLIRELRNWIWLDRKGEVPADENNHLIDAGRYAFWTLLKKRKKRIG
jgi:phage terminase large subunit